VSDIRVPGSGVRISEPETRNPKPGTRNPEPGTRNPEPGYQAFDPGRAVSRLQHHQDIAQSCGSNRRDAHYPGMALWSGPSSRPIAFPCPRVWVISVPGRFPSCFAPTGSYAHSSPSPALSHIRRIGLTRPNRMRPQHSRARIHGKTTCQGRNLVISNQIIKAHYQN